MAECEGFICPLCMREFRGVPQLEQHYQDEHAETTQSRFRSNLKSIFGKFKKKNQEGDSLVDEGAAAISSREDVGVVTNISGIDPDYWEPQQFGFNRDLMMQFRRERDVTITQIAAETNRLIIRVERLFRALQDSSPRTSKARKELERSVVYWRDDKRCRSCGRGFNLRRRKHHCRLCGDIMCKQCSLFMSLSDTYPVLVDCPDFHSLAPLQRSRVLSFRRGRGRKKRGQREEEEEEEDEEDGDERSSELRMCSTCQKLIQRKLQQCQSLEKPLLSILYDKMQVIITTADAMKPSYLLMADSIIAGEHGYRLQDAVKKRQELIRMYEAIDGISKDIFSLVSDTSSDPSASSQRMVKLCRGVRIFASNYLQDNLLTLPSLPTMQKLAEIRETKEMEAKERLREIEKQRELHRQQELSRLPTHTNITKALAEEQRRTIEEDERGLAGAARTFSADPAQGDKRNRFEKLKMFSTKVIPKVNFKREMGAGGGGGAARIERLNSGSGWMGNAEAFGSMDSQDDPFTLQRQQLLGFIQQARAAGRADEVAALEESLCEIESLMSQKGHVSDRNPESTYTGTHGFD